MKKGSTIKSEPPLTPLKHTKTKLVGFESAPFPFHGVNPSTGRVFLTSARVGGAGHRTSSGEVYWEDRLLAEGPASFLHIPKSSICGDLLLMVFFLHGHGAILQRDVMIVNACRNKFQKPA